MKFSGILAELRHDKRLLQKDIADQMSLSIRTISNYETGTHYPDIKVLL